jgi:hypothetical protein
MLRDYLVSLTDDAGNPACEVVARDRNLCSEIIPNARLQMLDRVGTCK